MYTLAFFNYFVVDRFLVGRVLLGAIIVMIASFSGKLNHFSNNIINFGIYLLFCISNLYYVDYS